MWRTLRPGGLLFVCVPNLASLHNRVLLAAGRQPTSIRTIGPHVRGFTQREIAALVRLGGSFELAKTIGVGFYPLPPRLAGPVARLWPGGSHTTVVVARRAGGRPVWLERTSERSSQTHWSV
jgi:hypothetical protein